MLAASSKLEAQALRLTELVMREGRPILAEQPLAFDPAFGGRRLVVQEADRVVSSLTILHRHLLVDGMQIPVGLIGSVVTDEAYRGTGLASQLLLRAEDQLRAGGALLALLWADDAAFYETRGYASVGTELDYRISSDLGSKLPPCDRVRTATPSDIDQMHRLYCTQSERVDRKYEETQALALGPGIRALVHENQGQVDAYALEGRGEDLQGVIHEWAGSHVGVLACMAAHLAGLASKHDGLWCLVPARQVAMQSTLNALGAPGVLGILGMGKLLRMDLARDWFNRRTPASVQVSATACQMRIQGPGGELELDGAKVLQALIPAKADRATLDKIENAIGLALPELPEQPFLWGLDSI